MRSPRSRLSAKALISDGPDSYIFVAGKRGRWSLPGGGPEEGESMVDALRREIPEEIGIGINQLKLFGDPFTVNGETSSAAGICRPTIWTVYAASLLVEHSELYIPEVSEITAIGRFTAEQSLAHDNMSELAQQALHIALGL